MPTDHDDRAEFRSRLARIPRLDDAPDVGEWARATPPVISPPDLEQERRRAPVARPPTPDERIAPDFPDDGIDEDWIEPPRRRRRWRWVLGVGLALAVLLVGVPLFLAWRTFDSIERIDLGQSLTPASAEPGTNILLVGTDSREGIGADEENAAVILGDGSISGQRSDTIMVLRLHDDGTSQFLSLPRDLWLPIDGGSEQRINTAIGRSAGPAALVNTIQLELGVPIHNYVQIDLAGFIELVDAVGGVTITIPHPAFDRASGLDLPTAGDVTLDSAQALAYVRSRRYTEVRDGVTVTDPTSDLGRVQRQQEFMRALFDEAAAERNPLTLNQMAESVSDALVIDDQMTLGDVVDLTRRVRSGAPESVVLPTRPANVGGNSVLLLADGASTVLAGFGA